MAAKVCVLTFCLATVCGFVQAQDDDPLPAGAIATGTTRFRPPEEPIAVSFLPDQRTLVVTTHNGRLQYWDAQSGRFLREVRFAKPHVSAAAHAEMAASSPARLVSRGNTTKVGPLGCACRCQTGQEREQHEISDDGGRHIVLADNISADSCRWPRCNVDQPDRW